MTKLVKFFVICAAVLVTGVVMAIVGFATGGVDGFQKVADDHDWVATGPATVEEKELDFDSVKARGCADIVIAGENNYQEILSEYGLQGSEARAGKVIVIHSKNVAAPKLKLEGKTLLIDTPYTDEPKLSLDFSPEGGGPTVIVFCGDSPLKSISVSSSVSDVDIYGLAFDQGEIELKAGDLDCKNIVSKSLKIDCEAGDIELHGEFSGRTEIFSDLGDVEVDPAGDISGYTILVETEMGGIDVGGKEYEGGSYTQEGGDSLIQINAKSGDVEIGRGWKGHHNHSDYDDQDDHD